jgi:tetratricopeptide (TPR) repeat protein
MRTKLGTDDPLTLSTMANLGGFYEDAGRPADALRLREEVLQLRVTKFGSDHPLTLKAMYCLARCYYYLARHADALKLYERTLALQTAKLGRDHPDTLSTMGNLAASYGIFGRLHDAIELGDEAYRLKKAKFGPEHPDTLFSMQNLALYYATALRSADALRLVEELIAVRQRRLQSDASDLSDQLNLALTYQFLGQAEQSRNDHAAGTKAYARSVEMFEKLDRAGDLQDATYRGRLRESRWRLSLSTKAERAVHDLEFALKQPQDDVPRLLDWRVRYLLDKHEVAAAVESAAKAKQLTGRDSNRLYDAACLYGLCSAAAKDRLIGECADEAMNLLRQAVANGFRVGIRLARDPDLASLRGRDDFKKLLQELEEKE